MIVLQLYLTILGYPNTLSIFLANHFLVLGSAGYPLPNFLKSFELNIFNKYNLIFLFIKNYYFIPLILFNYTLWKLEILLLQIPSNLSSNTGSRHNTKLRISFLSNCKLHFRVFSRKILIQFRLIRRCLTYSIYI